jgi:hypothetical protein
MRAAPPPCPLTADKPASRIHQDRDQLAKDQPTALMVCPTSRGRTEVQIPRDEKREREVAKATVERIGLPVAHKMQRL